MDDQSQPHPIIPRTPDTDSADADPALRSYRFAAAVLSTFDPTSLQPTMLAYANDDDAVLDLLEECERIHTQSHGWHWMLKNSVRRHALKELATRETIRKTMQANVVRPDDTLQRMFEAYINQTMPPIEQQTIGQLTATLQVLDWLDGILDDLPDRQHLTQQLEWQQLLQPFRELAGDHFRGRTKELTDLTVYVTTTQRRRSIYQSKPLMIFGPGGVGKSTLVAKLILKTVDEATLDNFAFCYWDFDRATLLPEEPVTLLAELVLQLSVQVPSIRSHAQTLRQRWLNALSESSGAHRIAQTQAGQRSTAAYRDLAQRTIYESRTDLARFLSDFEILMSERLSTQAMRLLLVLDTFERVQELSFEFTRALWDFLNEVQRIFPLLRVIVVGRAQVNSEIAHVPYELKELDEEAAKGYLSWRGVTSPQLADDIFKRVGGDPLSLRLSVDGLQQDHSDLSALRALPPDFDELSLDHELNQGWLYRRYLNRIHDPAVQQLAHPGLVLRRVTPALIRHVLAEPCGVVVPSDEVAEDLFERLAQQASLVTREEPKILYHRADVRKRMLRALLQTAGDAVFEIHRRAVDFYAQQPPSPDVRAEEIYHRLFMARSRDEIDPRWVPGVARLLHDAVTEIPMEMRSYLISKLETTSTTFNWNEADTRSKEDFVATRAQDAIIVNQLREALRILSSIRDRLPGSKLYRLEAQVLERLGRYAEAWIVASEGLFSARKARDDELALDLLLIGLRANEILGQYQRAAALLGQAERLEVKLNPSQAELLRIELGMHRLRLCRLAPAHCTLDTSALRQDVYASLDPLFELAARQNALLLLDTVEEIGVEWPEAVTRALIVFKSTFDSIDQRQLIARLLREYQGSTSHPRSAHYQMLMNIAQSLESDQHNLAMEVPGMAQHGDWAELFRQLSKEHPPTQPLVSALVELIRGALGGKQEAATAISALLDETVTALFSAFETRDQLLAFLQMEFGDNLARLSLMGSFNTLLMELVTMFEREGKTELLIDRALAHRPDNPALRTVQQIFAAATSDSPTFEGTSDAEGGQAKDVSISGNFYDSTVWVRGNIHLSGNVYETTLNIFNPSIPPEELAVVPKIMPPFGTTGDRNKPRWAAPELVFNWALGMRQAMRAVCLVETVDSSATGFLVAPNLLLFSSTLNRATINAWQGSLFRFDYCHGPDGSLRQQTVYPLAKDWLAGTNSDLGYILLRLEGTPGMDLVPGEDTRRGWLSLSSAPIAVGENVCMLHHASGGPQMLEYAAAAAAADGKVTLFAASLLMAPGTGGAPCCNDAWEVVALRLGRERMSHPRSPLRVVWVRDLLADAEFTEILKQHLPEA